MAAVARIAAFSAVAVAATGVVFADQKPKAFLNRYQTLLVLQRARKEFPESRDECSSSPFCRELASWMTEEQLGAVFAQLEQEKLSADKEFTAALPELVQMMSHRPMGSAAKFVQNDQAGTVQEKLKQEEERSQSYWRRRAPAHAIKNIPRIEGITSLEELAKAVAGPADDEHVDPLQPSRAEVDPAHSEKRIDEVALARWRQKYQNIRHVHTKSATN